MLRHHVQGRQIPDYRSTGTNKTIKTTATAVAAAAVTTTTINWQAAYFW